MNTVVNANPNDSALSIRLSGVLTFVFADLMVFAFLFIGFLVDRQSMPEVFHHSSLTLNKTLGLANTLILITSGACMVMAVHSAQQNRLRKTRLWLVATMATGSLFGINKVLEYQAKIADGITMLSNEFYMFYYALTGAHCLHFLGGMVALVYLIISSYQARDQNHWAELVKGAGLYWHMVDLLWIFIFPLLYLLGSA